MTDDKAKGLYTPPPYGYVQQKGERKALFAQPVGYYQKDGVWYGPCSTVIIWAKEQ